MVVNDNAGLLDNAASLSPSRASSLPQVSCTPVGASLLAMVVNDIAGLLVKRGVL